MVATAVLDTGTNCLPARDTPELRAGTGSRVFLHQRPRRRTRGRWIPRIALMMGEFGHSQGEQPRAGRDHHQKRMELVMTGCALKRGIVTGATDADGGWTVIETRLQEQNICQPNLKNLVLLRLRGSPI